MGENSRIGRKSSLQLPYILCNNYQNPFMAIMPIPLNFPKQMSEIMMYPMIIEEYPPNPHKTWDRAKIGTFFAYPPMIATILLYFYFQCQIIPSIVTK